jgi:hypothetical protein
MRSTALALSLALLSSLAVGVAVGAPTAGPAHDNDRPHVTEIPNGCGSSPDRAQCLTEGWLETRCGRFWAKSCENDVKDAVKAHHDADPSPKVKLLRPGQTDMPEHVRDGKRFDYPGPKSKAKMVGTFSKIRTVGGKATTAAATPASKRIATMGRTRPAAELVAKPNKRGIRTDTSDNIFARTGLTRPPHSGLVAKAKTAHRDPAWDGNGQTVETCEEYAYEKVYDWGRYTDAAAACAGDVDCQLDIAFLPSTPGIASRELKAKDGTPLRTQIIVATRLDLPKNDFFAYGAKFVYAGGPEGVAPSADLDRLVDVMKAGEIGYRIGPGGDFADEWAFHRARHDGNRGISRAEFEEYERRKAAFRELASQYQAAVRAEREHFLKGRPAEVLEWVNPIDMVTIDPFERTNSMTRAHRQMTREAKRMSTKAGDALRATPGAGAVSKSVPGGTPWSSNLDAAAGPHGAVDRDAFRHGVAPYDFSAVEDSVHAVLAAPKAGPAKSSPVPGAAPSTGGSSGSGKGSKKQPPPTSTPRGDEAKSKAQVEATLCDPKRFPKNMETFGMGPISCQIGRMIRAEWRRKLRGQKSCLDPDDDDCDWSPMMFEARFTKGVPYISEQNAFERECATFIGDDFASPHPANLAAADAKIEEVRQKIAEEMRKLADFQKTKTDSGVGKGFGKAFTDADHFGDKDWFAAGYDYVLGWEVEPVQVADSNVCQLGGGARGGFGIDGWFIGQNFEVVDALASIEYNKKGDRKGHKHAHLNLFESSVKVIDPEVDGSFSGSFEEPIARGTLQIPQGMKPSFNFMAGPVPITGAVWGEFFYGAKLKAVARTEATCDMSKMTFGATATFTPEVGLNAKAQVGVGISGLLSVTIRGMVNLLTVGVPVEVGLNTKLVDFGGQLKQSLGFTVDVRLSLATLSGYLALAIEALFIEEEFVLFRWNGLGPEEISLLGKPLEANLPLSFMSVPTSARDQ